jgi:hypothetical protein
MCTALLLLQSKRRTSILCSYQFDFEHGSSSIAQVNCLGM